MGTRLIIMYCNFSKIGPHLFEWNCCRGCFSLQSTSTYLWTWQYRLGYVRSSCVQASEEEQTKWRQTPFPVIPYVRKHITKETLQNPRMNTATLKCMRWMYFREIALLSKTHPPSFLQSSLHPGCMGGEKCFSPPMQTGYEAGSWC